MAILITYSNHTNNHPVMISVFKAIGISITDCQDNNIFVFFLPVTNYSNLKIQHVVRYLRKNVNPKNKKIVTV